MIKKILIVDDHFIVRSGMSLLLENELDNIHVFEAGDFREALAQCTTIMFDLVILDINLPDGRKCNMVDDLRKLQKEVKILIFSAHEDDIHAFRYIQAGANGYLNKLSDSDIIVKAVKEILESGRYISIDIMNKFIAFSQQGRKSSNPLEDLTQREFEIAELFVKGYGNLDNDSNDRSAMFYGSLDDDKMLRPNRKFYSADGTMEVKYNKNTGATEFVTYIGGDGYSAPIILKSDGSTQNYLYLHRDYQGSILAITDANGNVVEKRLFDAWGSIAKVQDGAGNNLNVLTILDRGYTGHEHLQSVGLINMNGRIYDAKLHRFLQPDNYVQDPSDTQNYNRYGYCWNNPFKYTDPSGENGLRSILQLVYKAAAIVAATIVVYAGLYLAAAAFIVFPPLGVAVLAAEIYLAAKVIPWLDNNVDHWIDQVAPPAPNSQLFEHIVIEPYSKSINGTNPIEFTNKISIKESLKLNQWKD